MGSSEIARRFTNDFARPRQRDVTSGDRRGARAAVRLQYVAVNCDGALAQRFQIGYGT